MVFFLQKEPLFGEEELFAYDKTYFRLTEMQSKAYWNQWEAHMANKSYQTTSDHH